LPPSTITTVDDHDRVWHKAAILVGDGLIAWIGAQEELCEDLTQPDEVIDKRGLIAIPGLIRIHDHMFQLLTRAVLQVQYAALSHWLRGLYPIRAPHPGDDPMQHPGGDGRIASLRLYHQERTPLPLSERHSVR